MAQPARSPDRLGRKPTAGFRSQGAAVRALHAQGVSPRKIAADLGLPINTVNARLAPRRPKAVAADGGRTADPGGRPPQLVELLYDVKRLLRPFAASRDTTVPQIAAAIVEAALERGLVDQLLAGRF